MPWREKLRVRDLVVPGRRIETVLADTPFREVVRRFVAHPELKCVFVVDSREHLVGILDRHDLVMWASSVVGGRAAQAVEWAELVRMARATTALDACREDSAVSVHVDDLLDKAFLAMVRHEDIDVPVIDDSGRIVGDLRLSEVLDKVLQER
jgi:CBS-domain-containing membrane protein